MYQDIYYEERAVLEETNQIDTSTETTPDKPKVDDTKLKYKQSWWAATRVKRLLGLTETIPEIMTWTSDKKRSIVTQFIENNKFSPQRTYSKLLVIITGNVDELYTNLANSVDDADTDADILYEISKKLNLIDLKQALLSRFFAEQIARLGSNHIIYPSLNKDGYSQIIKQKLMEIVNHYKERFDINIDIDASVNKFIYENSVFPTQGVRPVFSLINSRIESPLSGLFYKSFKQGNQDFSLYYDAEKQLLVAKGIKGDVSIVVDAPLAAIASTLTADEQIKNAVHEAGHVIQHVIEWSIVPKQAKLGISYAGFIMPADKISSVKSMHSSIKVLYAGMSAEEVVFGKDFQDLGGTHDATNAFTYLSKLYLKSGCMQGFAFKGKHAENSEGFELTENQILILERKIEEIKNEVIATMRDNKALLLKLSKLLYEKKQLLAPELYTFFTKETNWSIFPVTNEESSNNEFELFMSQYEKEV
jgi:cell division protease FtsH